MNKKEKKAIEFLKTFINTEIDYCKLEKTDVADILNVIKKQDNKIKFLLDNEKSLKEMNRNQMKIIEKQQKEIEGKNAVIDSFKHTEKVLTEQLDKQQKEIEELKEMKPLQDLIDTNIIIADYSHNYISKDKIRKYFMHEIAFKKRLQREKQKIDKYNRGRFDTIEEILELLEEN